MHDTVFFLASEFDDWGTMVGECEPNQEVMVYGHHGVALRMLASELSVLLKNGVTPATLCS